MNGRLRMHDDLHLVWRQVEKPASLNHLEALVHQRSRVNGDAPPHLPGRMVERLLHGDGIELRARSAQKRPAGSRQPDALDFLHAPATQALMHRVVLAVDRQQRLALLTRLGSDQLSGGDQAFLVGEANNLAGANRLVSGLEPGDSDDGADHKIDLGMSRDSDGARGTVDYFNPA